MEASSELRFPIMSALNGSFFFDYGSDLDSGATVIGDPAGARNKPGRWVCVGQLCFWGVCARGPAGCSRVRASLNSSATVIGDPAGPCK